MKFGIMEGVLKQPWDNMFQVAKELGFDGMEVTSPVAGKVGQLSHLSRENRVEVSSLICWGRAFGGTPVSERNAEGKTVSRPPTAEERTAARHNLIDTIANCEALGAGCILLPVFSIKTIEDEASAGIIEDLKACAGYAERHRVVIGYEGALSAGDMLKLLDRVGSDYVQCYYDIANVLNWGYDPAQEIRQLAGRLCAIHIKDYKGQYLGEGQVNLAACCQAIKDIGYSHYLTLETVSTEDPISAAKKNLTTLQQHL
jgi:sugar phosphate isomerase/epimerase